MQLVQRPVSSPEIRAPFGRYNHGIIVPPGASLLVASGQLGVGPNDVAPESFEAQARLCFQNCDAILAAAGMNFANVIRIAGFVTRREDFATYMRVRDEFTREPFPVSTLLIVSGFTRPEFLVEVEITAAREL